MTWLHHACEMVTGRFANVSARQRPVRQRMKSFRQRLLKYIDKDAENVEIHGSVDKDELLYRYISRDTCQPDFPGSFKHLR